MEQIKRSRNSSFDDHDDSKKRKKINVPSVEPNNVTYGYITAFEDLSNELIYEIFELLDFHQAFQGFYDLNTRFRNLFIYSKLPIESNISSISKSGFQHYLTQIIIPHVDRIKLFRLSNPFAADMSSLLLPIMINFSRLETLIINNIESRYIKTILDGIFSLPVLSSLSITSIDHTKDQNGIYQKLFRLPALKYCLVSVETSRHLRPLPIATNEFSPIEHLIVNNKVSIVQVDSLLSYVPQLCRVTFGHLSGQGVSRLHRRSMVLTSAIDLSFKLHDVSFNEFELLITDFFPQVQCLRISTHHTMYFNSNAEYVNADRWEHLISTHMPKLHHFDFQHQCGGWRDDANRQIYETRVNKFNSSFWMKHQWFFEHQSYQEDRRGATSFYSRNAYRKKYYLLHGGPEQNSYSFRFYVNDDPAHHVWIRNQTAMEQLEGGFPSATELTLSEGFQVLRNSVLNSLSRLIPVGQLTKITLNCHRFPLMQVLGLLSLAPHVRTFKLASIVLYGADSLSLQANELFRNVSNTNTVTSVTIEKESRLDKIQLITALFPRLEGLTINLYKEDLESIVRFILSNNNTRHLSYLCVSKQRNDLVEKLRILMESEKLLHDYTLKGIERKSYLWW